MEDELLDEIRDLAALIRKLAKRAADTDGHDEAILAIIKILIAALRLLIEILEELDNGNGNGNGNGGNGGGNGG